MSTFRRALRSNCVALLAAALPGARIEANRATEVQGDECPFVAVYTDAETKLQLNDSSTNPLFDCTVTLHMDMRVEGRTPAAADGQLEALIDRALNALLTAPAFWFPQADGSRLVKNVSRITIGSAIKQEAAFIGLAQVACDIAYTDAYATIVPGALSAIDITVHPDPAQPAPPANPTVPVTVTFSE